MLDPFDLALLNLIQRDDSQTADQLAAQVALSPSAIARRLRRLRADGWIGRTIALLSNRFTDQRLRKKAETELGPKFDIRDFHAQILNTGGLPLSILAAKIDRWIAERKAG
jgi:uncharacterized protein (DUF885 family)